MQLEGGERPPPPEISAAKMVKNRFMEGTHSWKEKERPPMPGDPHFMEKGMKFM
jgi:hypothetical protein